MIEIPRLSRRESEGKTKSEEHNRSSGERIGNRMQEVRWTGVHEWEKLTSEDSGAAAGAVVGFPDAGTVSRVPADQPVGSNGNLIRNRDSAVQAVVPES